MSEETHAASRRVSRGIMHGLETGLMTPGQRLVETELAEQYGVGRNAVREAIQWLAAHGMIDVTRYRSAAIRQLAAKEASDVLDVAGAAFALIASGAAQNFRPDLHRPLLDTALLALEQADDAATAGAFSRARRHVYSAMLDVAANQELQRLFPALGLHILHAQHRSAGSRRTQIESLKETRDAIFSGDQHAAKAAMQRYIDDFRTDVARASAGPGHPASS